MVKKFLDSNNMVHILRAHQLCMEGFSVLYDDKLSTVWSAPNYCYRCGNMASILEVGPNGEKHFNVFDAAPENERDGPANQQQMGGPSNVSLRSFTLPFLSHANSRKRLFASLDLGNVSNRLNISCDFSQHAQKRKNTNQKKARRALEGNRTAVRYCCHKVYPCLCP